MAQTPVDICNSALIDVGKDTITALTDNSEQARICRLKWPFSRDAVIRSFHWRCLAKRATFTRLAAAPTFGYLYQYQLPPDCIQVRKVFTTTGADPAFEVEGNALLTDDPGGNVIYTAYDAKKDNVGLFDSLLTAAIGKHLAAEIAPALKGAERAQQMWAIYREIIDEAKLQSAIEAIGPNASCDSLVSVRP